MKPMYVIPTEEDFLTVSVLRLIQPEGGHFSIAQYREGRINLKMVIDFIEFDEKLILFDQSKEEEFNKAMIDWTNHHNRPISQPAQGMAIQVVQPQPQPPTHQVQLQGTRVIYHNGHERVIMLPIVEWEEEYFKYLKLSSLDIINP